MKQAFDAILYDTDTAILLARNERQFSIETLKTGFRNIDLFKTPNGRYFKYEKTVPFFGDDDDHDPELTPLTVAEAVTLYHKLLDRQLEFDAAFPDLDEGYP